MKTAAISAKRSQKVSRAVKKPGGRKPAARNKGVAPLDLSAFPRESVTQREKRICLACVLDVFTRHVGLALKTARLEIKRYTPSLDEVKIEDPNRPYFRAEPAAVPCPYCGAPPKWHAGLKIYRIESGKATDALRRELVKSLPKTNNQVAVLEERATRQHAYFEWLEKVSAGLDFDDPRWLREISLHYLSRKEPKVDWRVQFEPVQSIRRSRLLESGWEVDRGRLFLAPMLFDELILIQYLVTRSHKAGGLTLEGRYTLPELFHRLRTSGYLRSIGVPAHPPAEALEQTLEYLSGGQAALKFYYLIDRRDFLEKVEALKLLKPPRPRKAGAIPL